MKYYQFYLRIQQSENYCIKTALRFLIHKPLSLSLHSTILITSLVERISSMEESGRPSFRSVGGERRVEIVSGRGNYQMQPATIFRPESPAPVPSQLPWGFGDPEMKRRKRVAKYKVYSVEGRVKASFRNGLRWIKNKCSQIIHGY